MSAIKAHLATIDYKDANGLTNHSTLPFALREVRTITRRNRVTGHVDPNTSGFPGNWIGAMGYMTILDQIGSCYRPVNTHKIIDKPSIIVALSYFTSLSDREKDAIYALRNAFFHDFSLLNMSSKRYLHHFRVDSEPQNALIILPPITDIWDGKINNRADTNYTYVNLRGLGDLVEGIYRDLLLLESKNELALDLAGGEPELIARYFISHH